MPPVLHADPHRVGNRAVRGEAEVDHHEHRQQREHGKENDGRGGPDESGPPRLHARLGPRTHDPAAAAIESANSWGVICLLHTCWMFVSLVCDSAAGSAWSQDCAKLGAVSPIWDANALKSAKAPILTFFSKPKIAGT